ncbi:hypothetical protein ACA910_001707 [Epithemia clementina (nom. ined.)]
MPRRSTRKSAPASSSSAEERRNGSSGNENNADGGPNEQEPQPHRSVASHVRERQRAVAEREAARLARPEARPTPTLAHADRKKSAVTSTPSGVVPPKTNAVHKANAGWCGPFSVARQMIAQREEEARKREEEEEGDEHHPLDEVMQELEQERKRKQHPSISWKSKLSDFTNDDGRLQKKKKVPSLYETRKRRAFMGQLAGGGAIPSLYDLCIKYLVDNFEHVESVGFVDASIRKRLAHELVACNSLDDAALAALAVPGMEALEIVDASGITSAALASCLENLLPAGLKFLALDQAGRCFGPKAAQIVVDASTTGSERGRLEALSIGGAYLLKDLDAVNLISGLQETLQSLEFKACPLLGENMCKSLTESKTLQLRELSLEDLTFSDLAWSALETAARESTFWRDHLESLRLRRLHGLNDERMQIMLEKPRVLTALDVGLNYDLSDTTLAAIRASPSCGTLSELRVGGLKQLTANGLAALFTHVPDMGSPPRLQLLDAGQCDHEAVTDTVVELVAQASLPTVAVAPTRPSSTNTGKYVFGLAHLNIQGSTMVTDSSLEILVATCGQTLMELNVSFCSKLTDQGLGYFVDKCGPQLKSIEVWGIAQLSEVFFDGHKRVKDPTLQIVGAWMKKNAISAIR